MRLMLEAVFDGEITSSCAFGFAVLREVGLLREDWEGEHGPTRRLLRLFEYGYYKRLFRRRGIRMSPQTMVFS